MGNVNKPAVNKADAMAATLSIHQRVEHLAVQREVWETTLYAQSNIGLYNIIDQCLALYLDLTTGDGMKAKKQGLMDYINVKGYVFKAASPLTLKVIRCVFGEKDRRRLSTYHAVLCVAVNENWEVGNVAQMIAARGGVQEVSLQKNGTHTLTVKDKASAARAVLMEQSIATLAGDKLKLQIGDEKAGEAAVAVLTRDDNGDYSVHCVVHNDTAVNAVLAAYFAENKKAISDLMDQKQSVAVANDKAALIANAAKAANDDTTAKSA